jgi:hypothetical protein
VKDTRTVLAVLMSQYPTSFSANYQNKSNYLDCTLPDRDRLTLNEPYSKDVDLRMNACVKEVSMHVCLHERAPRLYRLSPGFLIHSSSRFTVSNLFIHSMHHADINVHRD